MLRNLKFPLIYILETLLWLPLFGSLVSLASFLAATPVAAIDLKGKSLPSGWEAAVKNHGNYLQGYVIENHPLAFAFSIALLVGSAALLYHVHKCQLWQRNEAGAAHASAHKIAQLVVFATLGIIGYVLVMHILVGVIPV